MPPVNPNLPMETIPIHGQTSFPVEFIRRTTNPRRFFARVLSGPDGYRITGRGELQRQGAAWSWDKDTGVYSGGRVGRHMQIRNCILYNGGRTRRNVIFGQGQKPKALSMGTYIEIVRNGRTRGIKGYVKDLIKSLPLGRYSIKQTYSEPTVPKSVKDTPKNYHLTAGKGNLTVSHHGGRCCGRNILHGFGNKPTIGKVSYVKDHLNTMGTEVCLTESQATSVGCFKKSWDEILFELGFKKVFKFKNPNSANIVNVYFYSENER